MNDLIIGTIGASILLLFYILSQFDLIKNTNPYYDAGNFIGAVLLAIYAYQGGVWPFVVLELVWAAVSLRDLMRDIAHVK